MRFDGARLDYKDAVEDFDTSITDRQLRERLLEVRKLAIRLRRIIANPVLRLESFRLGALIKHPYYDKEGFVLMVQRFPPDNPQHLDHIVEWADFCMESLAICHVDQPDQRAFPSAYQPGREQLVEDLMAIWCDATKSQRAVISRTSPAVLFVQEASRIISQRAVSVDAVLKWMRHHERVKRAVEHYIVSGQWQNPNPTKSQRKRTSNIESKECPVGTTATTKRYRKGERQ